MTPDAEPAAKPRPAFTVSTVVAGLIVVVVSYTGPVAVVLQAARAGTSARASWSRGCGRCPSAAA